MRSDVQVTSIRPRPSNAAKSVKSVKSLVLKVASGSSLARQQAAIQVSFAGRGRPRCSRGLAGELGA